MNISVLGCGRWGSFLAWYLNKIGHKLCLYGREQSQSMQTLIATSKNEYVTLPPTIQLTTDLKQAVSHGDVIIISISSQNLRAFLQEVHPLLQSQTLILCMKGIECDTGKRLTQVVADVCGKKQAVAVWLGPGHIQCFVQNIPNCMLIDSTSLALSQKLCDTFSSDLIKFYEGHDLIGNEIGAAAKNVIGIAAGILDGFHYGTLKGALMSRGAREVGRLIRAMGGNDLTAYGLCHLGDYETTLFSPYSNNKRFGEQWVTKQPFHQLAEGVKTTEGMLLLAKKHQVELPITMAVHRIVTLNEPPLSVLNDLFSRSNREEFY